MIQHIQERLSEVFRDVFDDDSIVMRPELGAKDVPEWDSLTHIRLLLTVERKFGVKFTVTEVGELQNVGDLMALIAAKLPLER